MIPREGYGRGTTAAACTRWANRLRHSDARSGQPAPGYSLPRSHVVPGTGGNTEFADMRAAYDALDDVTKAEIEDLITEHSIAFSRSQLGF